MSTEKELLQQVSSGNQTAFALLLDKHSSRLMSHILRLTKNREAAEEVTQDVFLKIWETREVLSDINNFEDYLFIVTRNHGINALNKLLREKKQNSAWAAEQLYLADAVGEPENYRQTIIEKAVDSLSAQQKKAWVMNRQLRMKYEQIALELGISKDAVNKYLQIGTKKVTQYIIKHWETFVFIGILAAIKFILLVYPFLQSTSCLYI